VAKGEGVDTILQVLMEQMRFGLRPSRASINQLLLAPPPADRHVEGGVHGSGGDSESGTSRLPVLLQVLDTCQLVANGQTVRGLLRQVRSQEDVDLVRPIFATLPRQKQRALLHEGVLLGAQARVDAAGTASRVLEQLGRFRNSPRASAMSSGSPPPALARRALLLACSAAGEHSACLELLRGFWSRGVGVDERTARRLIHAAGEGTRSGQRGAKELLEALRAALFDQGDSGPAVAQRAVGRRSVTAEHEAVRVSARAQWRAGVRDANGVRRWAISRLEEVGVPVRPKLVATCAHLLASSGDFAEALRLIEEPPCQQGEMRRAAEGPYLAVLAAVGRLEHMDHALTTLQLMVAAGIEPTLRTRIAFARMAARAQQARAIESATARGRQHPVPRVPLPGRSRFWHPQPALPIEPLIRALHLEELDEDPTVDPTASRDAPEPAANSLTAADPHIAETSPRAEDSRAFAAAATAADLVLEVQVAAVLERIGVLMRASTDGATLATMLSQEASSASPPEDGNGQ
jgi:hypothetical protein